MANKSKKIKSKEIKRVKNNLNLKDLKDHKWNDPNIKDYVINGEAFRMWVDAENSPAAKDQTYITKSGEKLNLRLPKHKLKEKIKGLELTEEESEDILAKATDVWSVNQKISLWRKRALTTTPEMKPTVPVPMIETLTKDNIKQEMIEMMGRFHSDNEIQRYLRVEAGYNVELAEVRDFRLVNMSLVESKQREYKESTAGLGLIHKRARADELSFLYEDRKIMYTRSRKKEDYELLLKTLDQIKREVEGDTTITLNANIKHDIEIHLREHISENVLKDLPIMDIILANAAVKAKVSPSFLISRLRKSYYAKYTGISPVTEEEMAADIIYPSMINYSLDTVQGNYHKKRKEQAEFVEYEELSDKEESSMDILKRKLKERLSQEIENVKESQKKVDSKGLGYDFK